MTSPSSTQNDIACLIDCLSAKDDGSKAQQALSNILGIDVPLDTGVDLAASSIAEKLGLKSDRSLDWYMVTGCPEGRHAFLYWTKRNGTFESNRILYLIKRG